MVKDCKVVLNNSAVTVVHFGDTSVQFPSIHRKADKVRVLYEDGKYQIVADDYQEAETVKDIKVKKKVKKTTKRESV